MIARKLKLCVTAAALACLTVLAPPAHAQATEKVSLRLDWTTLGYHAPFFLGVERGYYKEAGIDVQILEGKGSSSVVTLVGNDADDFAFADATTAARLIAQGLPAKVVMGIFQRSTLSLFFPDNSPMRAPADLKGKRVSMCAGDAMSLYLPVYLKAVGLNATDVRSVTVDCSIKYTVIAQGMADAVASYGTAGKPLMAAVGIPQSRKFDYADVGIFLPSHGLVASNKKIAAQPALIRKFAEATRKSWTEARANPDAAVAATVASNPLLKGKEQALKDTLVDSLTYLETPGTRGKPFGWQSPEEWAKARTTLIDFTNMSASLPPDAFFTNEFVAN
jgi:NitT/TauT family transport system substrate-binding protein